MKKFITDLLDENSTISSGRFMSIISLLAGIAIGIAGLYKTVDLTGLSILVGVFVGAAFTGKVMQKRVEVDGEKSTTTENNAEKDEK